MPGGPPVREEDKAEPVVPADRARLVRCRCHAGCLASNVGLGCAVQAATQRCEPMVSSASDALSLGLRCKIDLTVVLKSPARAVSESPATTG